MDKNAISVNQEPRFSFGIADENDIKALKTWFKNKRERLLWGGPAMQDCDTQKAFLLQLNENNFKSYSLKENKQCLAFAQIQPHSHARVHFGRLVVKPEYRGGGLSYVLLNHLFAEAKDTFKAKSASLFVYNTNTYAMQSYMKSGFVSTKPPKGLRPMDGCTYMLKHLL